MKIRQYEVRGKRRKYHILVMDDEKYAWCFDDYPAEDMLMIDGCEEAIQDLRTIYQILEADPSVIIYWPIKKPGGNFIFSPCMHVVMVRPQLQFRWSEWYKLKPKLDRNHQIEDYECSFDPKNAYESLQQFKRKKAYYRIDKYNRKIYKEGILGDTAFFVMPKEQCTEAICRINETFESEYYDGELKTHYIGYILSNQLINKIENDR